MKNTVKTIIENVKTIDGLNEQVNKYNDNIKDNVKNDLSFSDLSIIAENITSENKENHTDSFLTSLANDRKIAFDGLLKNPCYNKVYLVENVDNTIKVENILVINNIVDIEKRYRLVNYKELSKTNGKPIPNKSITIFGVLRFYGLLEKFIENLMLNQVENNGEYKTDLTRINLVGTEFTEQDGKCFDGISITALDKQLRVLTKFFGDNEIKTKKKDLVLLRSQVIKMKFDVKNLNCDFSESKTNAFIKVLYKYFVSIYNNHNTQLTNSNGKTVIKISKNSDNENSVENIDK